MLYDLHDPYIIHYKHFSTEKKELKSHAMIRLHDISVFHNVHHVRLDKHSATNSCHILVRTLTTLQAWPWPIIVLILTCYRGGEIRNCQWWLQMECHITCQRTCQTRREYPKKFWLARFFIAVSWSVPDATSLFFNCVTLQDPFSNPAGPIQAQQNHVQIWLTPCSLIPA